VPEGFRPIRLGVNPFLQANGPLFGRVEGDRFVVGLLVEERHCNPGGHCHGGMLLTLSDMTLIVCSNVQAGVHRYMTTVNLTADFIRAAPRGAWIEGRTEVLRVARSLVFSQAILTIDGEPAVRASAILKPTGDVDERFGVDQYFRDHD